VFGLLSGSESLPEPFRFLVSVEARAVVAGIVSFAVALVFGRRFIRSQSRRARVENVHKTDSARLAELHGHKRSTPTMGGVILLVSLAAGVLAGMGPEWQLHALFLATALALGSVGFADDWIKLTSAKRKGLSARTKFSLQLAIGAVAGAVLYALPIDVETARGSEHLADSLLAPWFGAFAVPLGVAFILWVTVVVTSASNAVNLTDGLDGLAVGCSVLVAAALTLLASAVGSPVASAALSITHVPLAREVVVFGGALIGAGLGFLWFNCHPAEVFMGDTGSLPLGGLLGLMAIVAKLELLLVLLGGVLVAEALSVVLQVGSYKLRGKRIFRCAPLHHHFQFLGWHETAITSRFWAAALFCAVLSVVSLALRFR
jgi:phospho-N-acetylmuramoyl-pentapeptide-transferase